MYICTHYTSGCTPPRAARPGPKKISRKSRAGNSARFLECRRRYRHVGNTVDIWRKLVSSGYTGEVMKPSGWNPPARSVRQFPSSRCTGARIESMKLPVRTCNALGGINGAGWSEADQRNVFSIYGFHKNNSMRTSACPTVRANGVNDITSSDRGPCCASFISKFSSVSGTVFQYRQYARESSEAESTFMTQRSQSKPKYLAGNGVVPDPVGMHQPDENVVKLASPCAVFVPVVAIGSRTRQARRVDDEGARGGGLQACGPAGFVVEGNCRAASQGFCNSTATNCAEPMTRLCVGSE